MISRKEAQRLEAELKKIQSMENMVGKPLYNTQYQEEYKAHVRVDNSVEHGLFRPDPKLQGGWICSEQTFRAMKKNIFALDAEMIELKDNYECHSCSHNLDRQFWNFCPYCSALFK